MQRFLADGAASPFMMHPPVKISAVRASTYEPLIDVPPAAPSPTAITPTSAVVSVARFMTIVLSVNR